MGLSNGSDVQLRAINALARLFGVVCVAGGISGILGFALMPDHPLPHLIVGSVSVACGLAFVRVKPLQRKDLP
jgi:hypothetical protein